MGEREYRESRFHGILPVEGGYRVRVWSPEKWRTIGDDFTSLRDALRERNRLWREADRFTLKKVALRQQIMSGGHTNTGYARISESEAHCGGWYFALTIRDLLTGEWRHRNYSFETPRMTRSREQTLSLVLRLRALHAEVCNGITERYNAMARAECECLAEAEAEDLVPRIPRIYEFSAQRWLQARKGLDVALLETVNRLRDLDRVQEAVDKLRLQLAQANAGSELEGAHV